MVVNVEVKQTYNIHTHKSNNKLKKRCIYLLEGQYMDRFNKLFFQHLLICYGKLNFKFYAYFVSPFRDFERRIGYEVAKMKCLFACPIRL